MDSSQPSATALSATLLRAAHLLLDEAPPVFVDELALPLCGARDATHLRTMLTTLQDEAARYVGATHAASVLRAVRAAVLIRSRYTEEVVEASLAHGITQYVILGAGLDSFAYRRRTLLDRLRVFEVDHPTTQAWKQAQLRALSVSLPSQLTFVPLDFTQDTVMGTLRAGGYRIDEPVVFSCLGVSQYLPVATAQRLLTQLASAAPGSVLLWGYLVPESLLDDDNRRVRACLRAITAAREEPILTDWPPAEMRALLQACGWTAITDLGAESTLATYTVGRTDGLQHPQTHRLIHASIAAR